VSIVLLSVLLALAVLGAIQVTRHSDYVFYAYSPKVDGGIGFWWFPPNFQESGGFHVFVPTTRGRYPSMGSSEHAPVPVSGYGTGVTPYP
jgi:hypothetical protein